MLVTADSASKAPMGPAISGGWEKIQYRFKHLPVHLVLLRTGKVLGFGGTGNDDKTPKPYPAEVWDPQSGEIVIIDQELDGDVFCAGQVQLPDGRVLVAGGTNKYNGKFLGQPIPPFTGTRQSYIFDPLTEKWTRTEDMANARWYPTLVALGDGRVVAMAGLTKTFPWVTLSEIEAYQPSTGWSKVGGADRWLPLYPRVHLLPSGDIFYSGSYNTHYNFPFSRWAFPTSSLNMDGSGWTSFGMPHRSEREEGISVLLPLEPPDYKPRVLLAGGGTPQGKEATNSAEIIDLSVDKPTWRQISPMNFARYWAYATILPDKTVFVVGGRVGTTEMDMGTAVSMSSAMGPQEFPCDLPHDPAAILETELFDPDTETWTRMAPMTVDRLYHSNALLLPDGRVMTAGSNPARGVNECRIEIYRPPYFYKGGRPEILEYPKIVRYGSTFPITTPSADKVGAVALIRAGATTHCVNTDQRYVGLTYKSTNRTTITAGIPTNKNLAPPGWYMLFVVTQDQIPSTGRFVQVT